MAADIGALWPSFETRGFAALLRMRSSPHLVRQVHNHAQLGPLLVLAQQVAFFCRGEAALRREAELLWRDVFGGLVNAALEVVCFLKHAELGRDEPEHDLLVAFRDKSQRLKPAGALGVVFEEEAVI